MAVEVLPGEGERRGGAGGEAVERLPQGVPLAGQGGDGCLQLRHRHRHWSRVVRAGLRHRPGGCSGLGFWSGGGLHGGGSHPEFDGESARSGTDTFHLGSCLLARLRTDPAERLARPGRAKGRRPNGMNAVFFFLSRAYTLIHCVRIVKCLNTSQCESNE